ncbi:MAG: dephospho-CoA kinase [Armatimonadota bacterium]|nr:dephospho-CoA kinase [Armatimonadota bacterium]MDR5676035.1 dephospho-CoA kinase [Armatimonadota bacterium]MDR5689135.1 dephospho-CoA kinase [Armatimonadota bacterium]MDR7385947.1 dephospho-CoA kinase [Armatimonadota bacterium]MDR7389809.1 dephospho-CoA kinase [Armatimonadota bacterium]
MKLVALTGGIASGKTTVARMLRELGAEVVDADALAREVVSAGSAALQEIVASFGPELLLPDGQLDRRKLAERVFSDPAARARLNAIVHPRVRERMRQEVDRIRSRRPDAVVVLDVPLLFDVPLPELESLPAIVVYASPRTQLDRLRERDRLTEEEAERRLRAQRPLREKLVHARWVVDNDGDLDRTRAQVREVWEALARDP